MTSPSWPERLPDLPTRPINHSAREAFLNQCPLTAIETSWSRRIQPPQPMTK
jgi:hypothetical protein